VLPDELAIIDDSRGMQSLLRTLGPESPAVRATDALLRCSEPIVVCTGFSVDGHPETDGPAGSIVLARALRALGKDARLVSWTEAVDAWQPLVPDLPCQTIPRGRPPGPLCGSAVTVEVCGRIDDGSYRNMRGRDVRPESPWFEDAIGTKALVSIGDGGNEFGMKSAPEEWFDNRAIARPVSTCDVLVVGQVSNWAALAVVAALSRARGVDVMPFPHEYQVLLEELVARGALDGVRRAATPTEDGHPIGSGPEVVRRLRQWLGG